MRRCFERLGLIFPLGGSYWVPNVSGGLVISKIAQKTKWDLDSNIEYARTAERVGFEYALSQIRFMAGYGAVSWLNSTLSSV